MKKTIFFCFILIFILSITYAEAPGVKIDSPTSTDTWYIGKKRVIKWTKSYGLTTPVKIRLYSTDGNTKIHEITNNTEIDKDFEWTIPGTISPNCYIIRVKTIDNKYWDDSKTFKIDKGILLDPGIIKQTLKAIKPDLKIKNITTSATCFIWVTVKNVGLVKIDKLIREKIWIDGNLVSQNQTHYVLAPGSEFSHQIGEFKAEHNGTKVKIFMDSDVPLYEITKSNNTLEKTLICTQRVREKI